jgi:hypothetical protein
MSEATSLRHINGSCHCGNIRFTFDLPSAPTIAVRACGCDMCSKHGGVWTSHPKGRFALTIADERRVTRYQFGTRTADFHVCATCGVVPIVTCVLDGRRYAVVNANAFDDVDRSELARSATDFEGESTQDRLARRKRNWTPEATGSAEAT